MNGMNTKNISKNLAYLALVSLASAFLPSHAMSAPVKPGKSAVVQTNMVPQPVRSVFALPLNPSQGRDPFFPNSKRPYEQAVIPGQKGGDISALVIKGFVGTGELRMVIINNHTFAPDDEGDVTTSQGRMHIRCVGISGNTVTVEVDGQEHELKYHDNL